jgi:hypothetical protein
MVVQRQRGSGWLLRQVTRSAAVGVRRAFLFAGVVIEGIDIVQSFVEDLEA